MFPHTHIICIENQYHWMSLLSEKSRIRKCLAITVINALKFSGDLKSLILIITDATWFQFVQVENIITVKAESVEDKRTWMNAIDESIKSIRIAEKRQSLGINSSSKSNNNNDYIGTLEVYLKGAKSLISAGPGNIGYQSELHRKCHQITFIGGGKCSPFCILQINDQKLKTKVVKDTVNPTWDQSLMFSLSSLDDILRITVYHYDRYGTNGDLSIIIEIYFY